MTERSTPKVVIWPFLLMDLVFFGLAFALFYYGHRPLLLWEVYAIILCVALGAWTFLRPFRTKLNIAESENLISAAQQIQKIEHVATQVTSSTSLWQAVHEETSKTAAAAKQVADQIAHEAKSFSEFLLKANDTEKGHLRLELEKLKRGETEWLEVLVRMLDHVFALRQGAVRSGQPRLIEQLTNFQNACLDTARRVGLNAFIAAANETFDPEKHQLIEGQSADSNTQISETVACGYSFRGQLLRPVIVRLKAENSEATEPSRPEEKATEPVPVSGELPL
ncbi:MAG: nucleotide exchange factor GrpE [Verrucomicrobia bacterium]|nr:nucleotide exchange factor GrpE [Verrucomicrobiota bacterium]